MEKLNKQQQEIVNFLSYIEYTISLKFEAVEQKITTRGGKRFFNIDNQCKESYSGQRFTQLNRLSNDYGDFRIEPGGACQYSVIITSDRFKPLEKAKKTALKESGINLPKKSEPWKKY